LFIATCNEKQYTQPLNVFKELTMKDFQFEYSSYNNDKSSTGAATD